MIKKRKKTKSHGNVLSAALITYIAISAKTAKKIESDLNIIISMYIN